MNHGRYNQSWSVGIVIPHWFKGRYVKVRYIAKIPTTINAGAAKSNTSVPLLCFVIYFRLLVNMIAAKGRTIRIPAPTISIVAANPPPPLLPNVAIKV